MRYIEEVSGGIDLNIWRNMPNVLGAVRRDIERIEHQVVESPEPSDSSVSSGYSSVASSPADSPAPPFGLTPPPSLPITPDPEAFRDESPEPIELRATPSPQLVPNAERRAESPEESTSEDRADVPIDSPPPEEEEGNLYEVLAYYAQRKSEKFELLIRYFPDLLNQRDNSGEDVDSGEGQGEGSSSQENPPPPEDSAASSSHGSQSALTSSQHDGPTSSGNPPRSASRRARHPTPSSRPNGLPPRSPPRSASSQSQSNPTASRHSSTSPSRHGNSRSRNLSESPTTSDSTECLPRQSSEEGSAVSSVEAEPATSSRASSPGTPTSYMKRQMKLYDEAEANTEGGADQGEVAAEPADPVQLLPEQPPSRKRRYEPDDDDSVI